MRPRKCPPVAAAAGTPSGASPDSPPDSPPDVLPATEPLRVAAEGLRAALDDLDIGNQHLVSGWRAILAERLAATTGGLLPGVVFGVASVIAMLASQDGIHITGEDIRVDGGTLA